MSSHNISRIESDIEKYIPMIIQREMQDDLFKVITITGCSLAKDLGFCKVYFTALSDMDKKELEKEVNKASSFIRGKLAGLMNIRNTPELRFYYDKSVAMGNRIEEILKEINEKDKN